LSTIHRDLPQSKLVLLLTYLVTGTVAYRALVTSASPVPITSGTRGMIGGLLLVYALLTITEPMLSAHAGWYLHLFCALQTALTVFLIWAVPFYDFFAILLIPPSIRVMQVLETRFGFGWVGVFVIANGVTFFSTLEPRDASTFALMYGVVYLFVGSYALALKQAGAARRESQALLAELQTAHRQLQAYAAQAEQMAATEERNRLGRELHDSVTQTVFSLALTARAARLLLTRDPSRAAEQLDRVHELAQNAVSESRSLISHLRPRSMAEHGLFDALRQYIAERQERDGLTVTFNTVGERSLPADAEEALYRIVQEALSNIVKHAQTDRAEVTLRLESDRVLLQVEDHGVGFDPNRVDMDSQVGHLGLTSMSERTKLLGGSFDITSQPQGGTCVSVVIPLTEDDVEERRAG
jgi:signal transduction histidine kinase